jgi:cytochrome c biogenesis protein CcmG, thiol:disulfide interchange protein DsbE
LIWGAGSRIASRMRATWLSTIPLLLLLALAGYFAIGLSQDPRALKSVLIDRPLPAFDLPLFETGPGAGSGARQRVTHETFKGRVSLVNVFASWCITCRVEHPVLLKLAADPRMTIVGLAWKDKPDELRAWLAELGNPYAVIADDAKGRTAIDLGVTGAPETFVVDKHGRIRFKHVGAIDEYVWRETLEPLVERLAAE